MADYVSMAMSRITDSISNAERSKDASLARYMKLSMRPESGLTSIYDKGVQAGILQNFKRYVCDSVDAPTPRGTQVNMMNDFGPFIPEVWPIVVAWYPDFPLKDLISVQSQDQDLAFLLFSKLVTGTNKAPTVAGQAVETPLGMRQINGYYPTGEVYGETIPTAQIAYDADSQQLVAATAYYALNVSADYSTKFMLKVTGSEGADGVYRFLSVLGNKIILDKDNSKTDSGSYMDIPSGGIYIANATGLGTAVIEANYVWNLDYAVDENIPKVKEVVERIQMQAKPRVLALQWTIFAEALKKSQFGTDIRTENTKRVLDLLYQYQVRYILDTMWYYAGGASQDIVINNANNYSLEVQAANLSMQFKKVATQIELASGRIEGNRIVCGKNLKSFLESLPATLFQPVAQPSGFSAPREIGTFGTFKVYYDQMRADDEAFMTYRGTEWYDAAMYMGVFLPFTPTDITQINVTNRQAFASMESYLLHKPACVVPMKITFAV